MTCVIRSNTENTPDAQAVTDSALWKMLCLCCVKSALPKSSVTHITVKRLVTRQKKRLTVMFSLLKRGVNTAKDKKT